MRALVASALLAAGLAGGWYVGSPIYAMGQLRDAARAGDEAALDRRVDFAALREDLKDEARTEIARTIADDPDNPFGEAGAAMAMALVGPMIDAFVTPQMVARLVREGEAGRLGEEPPADAPAEEPVDWQISREGLSRFSARAADDDGTQGPELEFARDGLGWRLVGLNLPTGNGAVPPAR